MTKTEQIIVATNTINLMAVQFQHVMEEKRLIKQEFVYWPEDVKALEDCLKKVKEAMEDLGNYIDGVDAVDETTLPITNVSFDILAKQETEDGPL